MGRVSHPTTHTAHTRITLNIPAWSIKELALQNPEWDKRTVYLIPLHKRLKILLDPHEGAIPYKLTPQYHSKRAYSRVLQLSSKILQPLFGNCVPLSLQFKVKVLPDFRGIELEFV